MGTEVLNRVSCLILESRPGKGETSSYASVRSWIDSRRLVPLRVEKYLPSGQLARRIDTTRVATDDKGRSIPADLTVRGLREDSVTDLDGSRIRHDVAYTDREFTPEGLTEVVPPSPHPNSRNARAARRRTPNGKTITWTTSTSTIGGETNPAERRKARIPPP